MENYTIQIAQTAIVFVLLLVTHFITKRVIKNFLKKVHFTLQRRRLTVKVINLLLSITALVFILGIWGVNQSDMVVFISSVMAVLGIAFVAQWSILSNISAGLILFFNHPLKMGDHIKIIEKDFVLEGTIDDITFFFVHIKTSEKERLTISNSLILQKTISVVPAHEFEKKQ